MAALVEVLVIARDERTVNTLCTALEQHGVAVDLACSAEQARALFLDRGGHQLLVIGPDVGQGMAWQVLRSLRSADPQLLAAAFGTESFRGNPPDGFTRIPDFHPSSRAGIGALLKILSRLSRA